MYECSTAHIFLNGCHTWAVMDLGGIREFHGTPLLKGCLRVCLVSLWKCNYMYTKDHTGDTQTTHRYTHTVSIFFISHLHRAMTEQVAILFFHASRLLCSLCRVKRNHALKFCKHRLQTQQLDLAVCRPTLVISPQNSTRNNFKNFPGGGHANRPS